MAWLNDMQQGRWARSLAGAAFVLGVALPVVAAIKDLNPLWVLFTGVVPGAAFVVVGIWATKRPEQLTSVVGAAVGALSAPAYYLLLSDARHPLDAGADIGRGLVGLVVPFILPFDMMLGAWAAARIETRGAAGSGSSAGPRLATRVLALVIGLGAVLVAGQIVLQATAEASAEPAIARWELLHHGLVPAVPIAALGLITAAMPSRLPLMCGGLIGALPALAASSLNVEPDPGNHGQAPLVLLAYTLPLTLPITVGSGILGADSLRRWVLRLVNR